MQATIYFYYLYILIISCLKLLNDDGQLPYGIKAKLRIINNFLNLFFSFYWWIFFIPYIEINCGLIVCSANSFLIQFRAADSCSSKP